MKIKAILIDAGGVFFKGSLDDFIRKASELLKIRFEIEENKRNFLNKKLVSGKINVRCYFREFFNIPISGDKMKKLIKLWNRTWLIDKEMIKLVMLLKKDYTLALFSNLDKNNSKVYRKKGWYSYFDNLILSFELGMTKPHKNIFKTALKKLKLKSENCLFIDDQKDNLITARKLEMKTTLFESPSKLKKDLKRMKII